ncbi:hypothetical protein HUW51_22060 [Adhaeribacter swui]|uniref:Uncharacterized protein n=1 Tax=Adhaeribacter swui TaxID=2086471 RepID=A0A7G7GDN6_9BACT|nr:hypothetical protein [Adhaeribacter swui]QNF35270.1 hypothetical protein HUW51_22060 [Adhaeribacter swui]
MLAQQVLSALFKPASRAYPFDSEKENFNFAYGMYKTTPKYNYPVFRQFTIVVVLLWAFALVFNQAPAAFPVIPAASKTLHQANFSLSPKNATLVVAAKIAKRRNALDAILPFPHFCVKLPLATFKLAAPGHFFIFQQFYRLLSKALLLVGAPAENVITRIFSDFVQPNAP